MKQRFSGFGDRISKTYLFVREKAFLYKKTSVLLVGVLVGVGVYYSFFTESSSAVTYQFATVKRGTLSSVVSATGQVTPNSQVDLKPKVNANVVGVNVRAGDRVKAGQVLFRLDATDAYKQVRDARTALASANIALEKLRNPKSIDVMTLENSIKAEEQHKKDQDIKVATAYRNLLNSGIQAVPDVAYTSETAPTISGSYSKGVEGQLKITVYQGGPSGHSFSVSGPSSAIGNVSTVSAQPLGDTGLFIKWAAGIPTTNWIINIPNKEASSYLTNLNAYQNAVSDRDSANAESDRTIASLRQKLDDLTPDDSNLDVQSAILTVQQRQNALLDAEQELSNYTLTAPFDGVMASVAVDVGSSAVMASANSSAALGTIVTDKKLVQITLNESDIVKVRIGQKAKITFDAIDGLSAEGDIVEINTLGTVTSGVVTYKVKIAFSANDSRILPNMSVAVDISSESKDGVLFVPNQAIKKDADGYYVEQEGVAGSRKPYVNASSTVNQLTVSTSSSRSVNGSSTRRAQERRTALSGTQSTQTLSLRKVPVVIGLQTDTHTEIISGLEEGDQVVTRKMTVSASSKTTPSITSLFRPQSQNRTTSAAGATRAQ